MSDFRFEGSVANYDYQGVGSQSNTTYMGQFRFKCILSPLDQIKADRLYRELIGSINPHLASKETTNYAFALSQLKVRLVSFPDFFKNDELDGSHLDSNILIELVNVAIDAQEEYKKDLDARLQEMQDILSKRIKNKTIEKEEEHGVEGTTKVENGDDIDPDTLPEVTLGEKLGESND